MNRRIVLLMTIVLLAACSSGENQQTGPDRAVTEDEETALLITDPKIIADNLNIPWSINKSGNVFYISERTGNIVKIEDGLMTRQKVELKKPLATVAEAGLLGFVLTPEFEESAKAIGYYTYMGPSGPLNRVIELVNDSNSWKEQATLLDEIPSGRFHHGGRLEIGPDGKLYVTTGDATVPELAQDLDSLAGKILRMNLDGSIPSDNPFPNSYVYSYGHRNPQGMTWDREGRMYASEHGPSGQDELNHIIAGQNYGWPTIMGDEKKEGMKAPLFHSGEDTWAPSGMAVYNGKIYVATLRGNAVREFDLEAGTTKEVISGLGRIRDILIEGDLLYFVSNNTDGRGTPGPNDDKLYRINLAEQ